MRIVILRLNVGNIRHKGVSSKLYENFLKRIYHRVQPLFYCRPYMYTDTVQDYLHIRNDTEIQHKYDFKN